MWFLRKKKKNKSSPTPKNSIDWLLENQQVVPRKPAHSSKPQNLKNFATNQHDQSSKRDNSTKKLLTTISGSTAAPQPEISKNTTAKKSTSLLAGFFWLNALLLFCLLPIAAWSSYQLQQTAIERINIEIPPFFSDKEIVTFLGIKGASFNQLDAFALSKKLNQLNWIKDGRVTKTPPNAVHVVADIRRPIAYLSVTDKIFLLDEEFVLLKPVSSFQNWDLPVVFLKIPSQDLQLGSKLGGWYSENLRTFLQQLQVSKSIPWSSVSSIDASRPFAIQLVTRPYGTLYRFSFDRLSEQLNTWDKAYPSLEKNLSGFNTVDLRVKNRIVVRYRS